MKKEKKIQPITDIEWTMLWMSIRYAMNGSTIATATLPQDIIKHYYKRLSEGQKQHLVIDIRRNVDNLGDDAFGHKDIDRPIWMKFWKALDTKTHYRVKLIDDTEHTLFDVDGRRYPLEEYISAPHFERYCPDESIKEYL